MDFFYRNHRNPDLPDYGQRSIAGPQAKKGTFQRNFGHHNNYFCPFREYYVYFTTYNCILKMDPLSY